MSRGTALDGREDVSRFVIHLTRNDKADFENGGTARGNFIKILKSRSIQAIRPHCLFNKKIEKSEKLTKAFRVACFTEVPLNQLHLLTKEIPGRKIKFEPYGFCFSKQFLIEAGGQPAIYINSYGGNNSLYDCVQQLYLNFSEASIVNEDPAWRILPFINAMHERYDFTWERESRVQKTLRFRLDDLVCVILPSEGEDEIKEACAKSGLAAVSPGWTYEQIVAELAKQQVATKFFWENIKEKRAGAGP
jgi:hypothetical protein